MRRGNAGPNAPSRYTNQMTRRFIPQKGIRHLSRDPLGRRIVRHTDAHQSPASVAKNYQAIEQLEGDGANHKQIDGGDPSGVIAQEGLPTLPHLARQERLQVGGHSPFGTRESAHASAYMAEKERFELTVLFASVRRQLLEMSSKYHDDLVRQTFGLVANSDDAFQSSLRSLNQ